MIIRLYTLLLSLVLIFNFSKAQTISSCFEIENILVDACTPPSLNVEGANEMVRFLVGPNSLNSANLNVTWANTALTWRGVCTNPVTTAALNATIQRCGLLIEPPGGIIPAGAKVILATSDTINPIYNTFANLTDTIYIIYQCRGNAPNTGHFANVGTGIRTFSMRFSPSPCGDTVSYNRALLVGGNGAYVNFTPSGFATYGNDGCQAPIPVSSVTIATNSGADTAVCPASPAFNLRGVASGVQSVKWFTTGSGSFSDSSFLNPTYTTSPTDIYPISFYLVGYLGCNDSLIDTMRAILSPNTIDAGANTSLCAGSSLIVFAAGGLGYTWSPPTYVSNVNSATPTLSPPITSTFYLSGTYGPGCLGQDSIIITVNLQDTILLNITDTSICRGQSVNISSSNVSAITYSPADGLSCTNCLTTIATPLNSITYTATSSGICPDTRTIQINIDTAVSIVNPPIVACGAYSFNGNTFTTSTTLLDTIQNSRGCDSVWISIPLTVLPLNRDTVSICINQGQSVFVGGANQNTSGFYNDTLVAAVGCDTVLVTELIVVTPQVMNYTLSSCYQVVFNGQTYTSSIVLRDTIQSALRCDSVYNITSITIKYPPASISRNVCINQGESYFAEGNNQTIQGIYYDTLAAANSCDSIIITNLSVVTAAVVNNTLIGCSQVTFNGITYTTDTLLRDTLITLLGCDSLITNTNISVNNLFTTTFNNICIYQGDSYFAGGANQTTSGVYTDNYLLPSGCDSTVITDLRVVTPTTITNTVSGCDQVTYNGVDYFGNATVSQTLSSLFGCDSVYMVTDIVVLFNANSSSRSVCINQGDSYFAGGAFQTTSGVYQDSYPAANGCDSIVQTNLNVVQLTTNNLTLDFCDVGVYNGNSYYSDTTISQVINSFQGCDSIVSSVTLKIHPTITYTITASKPMPITEGESVVLNSNFSGNSPYYIWSPDEALVSGNNQPTITVAPTVDTKYTMDFFAADSFCKSVDEFLVTVTKKNTPDPAFTIPTAFSPNGDGANDMLTPILQDGLVIEEFRIFNRWGELVFEETGSSSGWNGEYKGVKQPMGVYVYYLSVRNSFNSTLKSKAGSITLLR